MAPDKDGKLLDEALDALSHFCDRVESGEIRSFKTYRRFKEILKKNNRASEVSPSLLSDKALAEQVAKYFDFPIPEAAKELLSRFDKYSNGINNHDLVRALEELARLGNGDRYGNSTGNIIAQEALAKYRNNITKPE